jgi:hypothetical protein
MNSCPFCGGEVPQPDGPGRPRVYCGRRCQSRAERQRAGAYQKAGTVLVDEIEEAQMPRVIEDEGTVPGAQIKVFGGFNGEALRNASPGLRRRAQLADLEHERELQDERQAKAAAADADFERNVMRLAVEAVEAGKIDSVLEGIRHPEKLGRTRAEVAEMVWAYWDNYDARMAAAARRAYEAWQAEQSEAWDSSAPFLPELSAPEADAMLERGRKIAKARERQATRAEARKIARNAIRYHEMVDHDDDVTGGHHHG